MEVRSGESTGDSILRRMTEISWEAGKMQENVATLCDILDEY